MFYVISLVLIYFITALSNFHSPHLPRLVIIGMISFSRSLFLECNWPIKPCYLLVYSIVLQYFYMFQNGKSSCHLSPYKDVTQLLTVFPTLYISYCNSFILLILTESWYLFQKNNFIYLFIWLRWVFMAAWAFSLLAGSRGYSLVVVCRLLIVGASLLLLSMGSRARELL